MDEKEYSLNESQSTKRLQEAASELQQSSKDNFFGIWADKEWEDIVKELRGTWQDFPALEDIRQEEVKSSRLRLKVIEQDGEKFVIFPDGVLEQCGIGDIVDISVKGQCIVLKAVGIEEK
ncbi:MAG: hypothetical protein Q9M75_08975 [Ghiorsea sp.]|nr:hypothetical protein [Ghiorsea sp.]